jgi:hypothetical protein
MSKAAVPLPTTRVFSQRVSGLIGGNKHSGPFHEFPLSTRAAVAYNGFYETFNDFTDPGDFDVSTFEWNRTDGSASAYGAGTAIARIPDWLVSFIGSTATVTLAPSLTAAKVLNDVPFGVLRVDAGSADATGTQASRAASGTNVAQGATLVTRPTTYGNMPSLFAPHGIMAFGARFTVNETGTATQSALSVVLSRDENAVLSTAGAIIGTSQFGFSKALGSNVVNFFSRTSNTGTGVAVATIVPGTFVNVAAVCQRRTSTDFVADLYANGSYVATYRTITASQVPTAEPYAPIFACVNGTGADCSLDVDYVWTVNERV